MIMPRVLFRRFFLLYVYLLTGFICLAQAEHSHAMGRYIKFPDIPGYKTVKCDFHIHSVFSDGSVWPDIRVMEALKDGLDAISLTEHLEYQPHKADIPHPDRNRSYNLAVQYAREHNLIIVIGSEITRRMPPGHNNAIFLSDANKLLVDDSVGVFRAAKEQDAFVFWNHPNWVNQRPDGIATLTDMHRLLIREKLLHGIEVVNAQTYSAEALQIALDNNLTIMGTSDIHGLIDWDFKVTEGGHRPVTLVFAKEKNAESIREGLMNRRTVVFYKDLLIGRDEFLIPLLESILKVKSAKYSGKTNILSVEIENLSNADITLQNQSGFSLHEHADIINLKAGETTTVQFKTLERKANLLLKFIVLSAVDAPDKHPVVSLLINTEQPFPG